MKFVHAYNIAEILLKLVLNINQSINQSCITAVQMDFCLGNRKKIIRKMFGVYD